MTDKTRPPPDGDPARPVQTDARADRLKAALKANMARRKAQARARSKDRSDPDKGRQQETD
ncbi:MAG: hypothetical protein DI533_07110 [Cereibacter sphaeroides]|uniref:Uncharacterized protein n=1 Tax=Cereibacter sphaeroides TaxID=1063 RepID=A0A2W5SB95_CERSP|nr:MAG: hypothetical protein DI533_07110 [Cereibacter sphaeroides]